ncbi:hypothetical protein P7K49_023823 [Saguinus oedipus]|uniref:ENPP1-3/EXOG-like endonuclease/phosphodiesterase domain-containing protein n=1 Tax=Saguinus oedipus TaxID=9490 RepID=A0ABQ9UMS1_SAGOE|nr:hypothetical protein P7K49_023823 [Saguinus oedipus]
MTGWLLGSPALWALPAGLTLALAAGWARPPRAGWGGQEDARAARGLLGRLPVLPVAAAADLPLVPWEPAGRGPRELAKDGLPGPDPHTRGALWVVEQLRPERLRGDSDRRACDFLEDDSVRAYHRATNADYRGHLAAAANHRWSQEATDDSSIELRSYVMPNAPVDEATPLDRFLVPIESIDWASGLLFVPCILARAGSLKAIRAGSK